METEVRPKRVCSPKYAVQKARKGKALNRWELEGIAKDPELSFKYAKITKRRFPEGEPAIAQKTDLAIEYAREVIGGPFPEAEPNLLNHIENSWGGTRVIQKYFIANRIRNARVERHILKKDTGLINEYAKECIGGRWKEAEARLLDDRLDHAVDYHKEVLGDRWGELEDKILFGKKLSFWDNPVDCFRQYLRKVGRRIPELEENLKRCNRANILLAYSVTAVKGRLPPELHQKMMMFSFDPKRSKSAKKYLRFLDKAEAKVIGYLRGLDEDERQELLNKARTN